MQQPALVAVVGAIQPKLFRAFVHHYQALGIERFHIGFHIPEHAETELVDMLLASCRELLGPPDLVDGGPFWQRDLHMTIRERLRLAAGPGWHLLADSDEFQVYPDGIATVIRHAERDHARVVAGVLLDRIHRRGELVDWNEHQGLDAGYPLGGFLTGLLVNGSPRKIVLARHTETLTLGNHRSPGNEPLNDPLIAVHHFKWQHGVEQDLRRRLSAPMSPNTTTAVRATKAEAHRLLEHLRQNHGRIDIADTRLNLRPVSLDQIPSWWTQEARALYTQWRSPELTQLRPTDIDL